MITVAELSKHLPKDITLDSDYKDTDNALKPILQILEAFYNAETAAENVAREAGESYTRLLNKAVAAREENRQIGEETKRGRAVSYGLNIFQILTVSDIYVG